MSINLHFYFFEFYSSFRKWVKRRMFEKKVKIRLIELGKTQTELAKELQKRYHENIFVDTLNKVIKGKVTGPMAERVKLEIEQVLEDWDTA